MVYVCLRTFSAWLWKTWDRTELWEPDSVLALSPMKKQISIGCYSRLPQANALSHALLISRKTWMSRITWWHNCDLPKSLLLAISLPLTVWPTDRLSFSWCYYKGINYNDPKSSPYIFSCWRLGLQYAQTCNAWRRKCSRDLHWIICIYFYFPLILIHLSIYFSSSF